MTIDQSVIERALRPAHFQIGDPVDINLDEAGRDWAGEPTYYIVGIDWHAKHGVTYTTSEKWPPEHGFTDEWPPSHLTPSISPSPIAGKEGDPAFEIETRFWSIVDRNGLSGFPSDMWVALESLVERAKATPPAEWVATPGDVGKLCEAIREARYDACSAAVNVGNSNSRAFLARARKLDAAATLLTQMEARVEEAEGAARILQNSLATAQRIIAKREASEMAQAARIAALEKALEPFARARVENRVARDDACMALGVSGLILGDIRTARALLNPTPTEER